MEPSIGRVVLYTLSEQDVIAITKRRSDAVLHRNSPDYRDTGYVVHTGNEVRPGDQYPALIVRVWVGGSANLSVQLDGTDTYWATSVSEGAVGEERHWIWPPRV